MIKSSKVFFSVSRIQTVCSWLLQEYVINICSTVLSVHKTQPLPHLQFGQQWFQDSKILLILSHMDSDKIWEGSGSY